jgi:pimeloyl-ACP methyl ester carboxylesterase
MNKTKGFSIALLLLVFVAPVLAVDSVPRFEKSKCPFQTDERLEGVECGYVTVPENRADPNRRKLRLAVVILRSLSTTPNPDPLVFLSGGPGNRSVEYTAQRTKSLFWKPFREKRDLIFFDQRGTGYSQPHFCSELFSIFTAGFRGLPQQEQTAFQVKALQQCRQRMLREGIDFASYNSRTSAYDLDDIRRALGYEKWNLLGVSYGTRLALTAMRETPQSIRSVILDSPDPPNAQIWVDAPSKFARSLRLLFDQCDSDPGCKQNFPGLEEEFYALLDQLERNPMVLTGLDPKRFPEGRMIVDGTVLAAGIFRGLYDHRFIPLIPLMIREMKNRNKEALKAIADGLVTRPEDLSIGLSYSVDCYEIAHFNPRLEIEAEQKRFPQFRVWYDLSDDQALCEAWHDVRADSIEGLAVRSDIPTMILGGELDPITPPSYGKLAASTLTKSTFIEVRGGGHSVSPYSECTRKLESLFLANPNHPLNTSCLAEKNIPTKFVTNVYLNSGIYRLASHFQPGPDVPFITGLGLIAFILLTGVIFPPVGYLIRRFRKRPSASTARARKARWIAGLASLLALGFLSGLVVIFIQVGTVNPYILAFGVPGQAAWLFLLPWMVLGFTLPTLIFTVLAWKQKWWNRTSRIHYSLVAAACLAFSVSAIWMKLLAL